MKFIASVEKVKSALTACESLSRKGVLLSILEKVYIASSGNTLIFYTTNLRSSVFYTIPARIQAEGEILCDGQKILQVLQYVKEEQCTFLLEGGLFKITTEQLNVSIPIYSKDDYPIPLEADVQKGTTMVIKDCIELFESVVFSAALSDVHPELGNVFLQTNNTDCIAVATDSFRLAEFAGKGTVDIFPDGVLIPQNSVFMVLKILQSLDGNQTCTLSLVESVFQCATEGLLIRVQLSQGGFPDYKKIIPHTENSVCVINTSELINSLKLCGAFSDSFHKVKLECDAQTATCTISSEGAQSGSAKITQRVQIQGDGLSCIVNAGYIIPFLQHAHSDAIVISSEGAQKPLLLRPQNNKQYQYIVMPMTG